MGLTFSSTTSLNRDPAEVAKAYTTNSIWRNRDQFFQGTEAIIEFLTKKWEAEKGYRLRKELFAFTGNKIAVQVRRYTVTYWNKMRFQALTHSLFIF